MTQVTGSSILGQSDRDRAVYKHIWSTEGDRPPSKTFVKMIELATEARCSAGRISIADLGSGSGRHARWASHQGCDVEAVEYDETGLATQFANWERSWAVTKADVRQWLPSQPSERFDCAVCFDVLHHMANNTSSLEAILLEIRRIVRADGSFW